MSNRYNPDALKRVTREFLENDKHRYVEGVDYGKGQSKSMVSLINENGNIVKVMTLKEFNKQYPKEGFKDKKQL